MINRNLLERVRPLIEASLGYALPEKSGASIPMGVTPEGEPDGSFFAVRVDDVLAASARSEWHDGLRTILDDIHPDLLFSIAGSYEFSRITLPDGVAVWGPVPCYVADENTWRSVNDERVVRLTDSQLSEVDWDVFWHCAESDSLAYFGIYEGDRLVSLSSVSERGYGVNEIGVDAVQGSQGRGLGSGVVGAAGDWILENGSTPFASAADWNIASGRNLRRLGLTYTYSKLPALMVSSGFRRSRSASHCRVMRCTTITQDGQ